MNLTKGDAGNRSAAVPNSNSAHQQHLHQKLQHRGEKHSSASSRRGADMPSATSMASLASVGTSMFGPEASYLSNAPALMDVVPGNSRQMLLMSNGGGDRGGRPSRGRRTRGVQEGRPLPLPYPLPLSMPLTSISSVSAVSPSPAPSPSTSSAMHHPQHQAPILSMTSLQPPLNWASVASWFFRPEYSPMLGAPATSHPSAAADRPPPQLLPNSLMPSGGNASISSNLPPATSGGCSSTSSKTTTAFAHVAAVTPTSTLLHPSPHAHTMAANKEGMPSGRSERTFQLPTICTAIRCTIPSCSCECFVPGKRHLRYCDTCKHGWVPHALDKLGTRHLFTNSAPEPVQPNAAFDIASLILYGCQALPIRLKILLDRLFSVLQQEQVLQVLHGFGWTPEDYARGYILQQEAHGCSNLDKWSICSPEEEPLVLQQFLRFGETRAITQQLLIAQQVLQQEPLPTLERLQERLAASTSQHVPTLAPPTLAPPPPSHGRQAMSPSRRPASPNTSTPLSAAAYHPSARMPPTIATIAPAMSPHQKHPLHFLKLSPPNGPPPVTTSSTTSPSRHITSSPSLNTSPLNRLQNMQPFDFRKLGTAAGLASVFPSRLSPELSPGHRRRASDSCEPNSLPTTTMGLNLSMSTCLPPPLPLPLPLPPPPISHSAAVMAAVSANSLAAANLVASSFTSLVSTKMSTGSRSPSSAVDFPSANSTSDIAGSEDDDDMPDENSHSVLNLSRDREARKSSAVASQCSQSSSTSRQPRGLPGRKSSSTPTKRHWGSPGLPLNLGTQFINPATGKKRVQCNVCLKTFCDKGALKIHFSAVHLREMHKCTVEGCNMMFSSRRSRNRHSANPNPKLHSPHLRRKISPHDGRSAQAHPILIPPASAMGLPAAAVAAAAALNPLNHFGPFPLLTQSHDMRHHPGTSLPMEFKQTLDLSMQRVDDKNSSSECSGMSLVTTNSSNHPDDVDDDDDDDDGIVVVGGDDDDEQERCDTTNGISDEPEDFSMPTKRAKVSSSDIDEEIGSNVDSNEDSLSVVDTQSLKDESVIPTSKRKRKNQNPTRCAVAPLMIDDVATDEESSNEVFKDSVPLRPTDPISNERNSLSPVAEQMLEDIPSIPKCESPLNLEKVSPDVNANDTSERTEIKTSLAPLFLLDKVKREKNVQDTEIVTEEEDIDMERPASSMESNKSDESFDCSNALRQLESLSHGHFGELISRGLTNNQLNAQSPQFPPLGFMMGGSSAGIVAPPSPSRSQTSSAGSSNGGADSGDENSQNQIYGHFDNGQFISTMDVPIDKDNPRKCTACGKVFQNHFGVKTHYQNVHLKLMHKCNVDGCNAAFPSKRSRDRHSANLNLHRKLLSTSSDKSPPAGLFMEKSPFASLANNPSLPNEFLARIYAEEAFLLKSGHPLHFEQLMMNGDRIPAPPPPGLLLPPPLGGLPFPLNNFGYFSQINGSTMTSNSNRRHGERSSNSSSPLSASSPPPTTSPSVNSPPPTSKTAISVSVLDSTALVHCVEEDMPPPDRDGHLPCRLCRSHFAEAGQLKQHCEERHIAEMHRCTVPGCTKVFLSRTKRNIHAANDSAHRELLMASASRPCSVATSQEQHVSVSS